MISNDKIEKFNKEIKCLTECISLDTSIETYDIMSCGGGNSGSFTLGAMLFLNELCNEGKCKVDKIFGMSVGAIMGLLWYTDNLDINIYEEQKKYLNFGVKLEIERIKKIMIKHIMKS